MGEVCPFNTLGIAAQEYVLASKHAPSRMVGVHAFKNLCSHIPSEKMGFTISTESFSAERSFATLCEYDESVLSYYDQPQPIMVDKLDKNGKLRKISYTPDFLIEHEEGFNVVEVKPLDQINKLIEREPKNWIKLSEGEYQYKSAFEAFEKIGLIHRVWVYTHEYRYQVANISILLSTRKLNNSYEKIISKVNSLFDEAYYWTLFDLKEALNENCYSILLKLIDKGILHIDITGSLLSEPRGCVVVNNKQLLLSAKESFERANSIALSSERIDRSLVPSEKDALKVLVRIERIESGEKSRSVRRWKKLVSENKQLTMFQALIDNKFKSGNRKPRLNKKVVDFLMYHLKEIHSKSQGLSRYRSFIQYCVSSKRHHPEYDHVSFRTFLKYLNKIPQSQLAFSRGGRRSRNGLLEPTNPIERNLKFQLPWQAAAIDEYLADIYLVFYTSDGKPFVTRPWLTAMIDLATSKILAITISFINPSKRSLAKVIRECLRVHGKLPQEILFDRGSNFKSKYAAELLASLGIINTLRPAAYSRSGGEIEAVFGEFIKMWLSQRPGNLADYKEARSVDGKLAPKNKAVLKPYDFYRELKLFINWRDARPTGPGDSTRVDRFNTGVNLFPFMGIEVTYDEVFLISTAVDVKKFSVDPQRGIHIGPLFYWSPELSSISQYNHKVEVRIDPENPHVIFSLVNQKWVPCYSSHINQYNAKDFESQFIEGLIALETQTLKSKLRTSSDKDLVSIIESLNQPPANDDVKYATVKVTSNNSKTQEISNLFNEIKGIEVKNLKSGRWGK